MVIRIGHRFEKITGIRILVFGFLVALVSVQSDGQIFGGDGLFNRKTKAPEGRTVDEIGVPIPVSGRVEALRGHEVIFEIRSETKTPGATVEFLIRTFPSAGKIVSLVSNPNDRSKAIVTYYADPNSGATKDAFAFAAKYRGGRYSTAVRYDIDLVDHKSDILVSDELDFGSVMIGDEAVKEVTVVNSGNGSFSRQIFASPPWHIVDPAGGKLMIGPNGRYRVKIAFRPELSGKTSYFLNFSRSKLGTTKLEGEGIDSFSVVSEELELVMDEETGQRIGEFILMNHSDKPFRVEARASSRIQNSLGKTYFLSPGKESRFPVKLERTDTAPFDGMIQFSLKSGYTKTAKVVAKVVPGRIGVSVPNSLASDVVNFGQVAAGRSTERQITLTNHGGVAVPLEFHIPEPFRMLTDPGPTLGSLSSVNISIGLYPAISRRGLVDATMNVYSTKNTVPVRLLGNVIRSKDGSENTTASLRETGDPLAGLRLSAGPRPKSISSGPDLAKDSKKVPDFVNYGELITLALEGGNSGLWYEYLDEETVEAMTTPSGAVAIPVLQRNYSDSLRSPEDLTVVDADGNSVTIGWTAPRDSGLCHFEVELLGAMTSPELNQSVSVWEKYGVVRYERIGRLVKATIGNLPSKSGHEVRVFMVDETGRSSFPSEVMALETESPMNRLFLYLIVGVVAVALGFGVTKVLRNRRPRAAQSDTVK